MANSSPGGNAYVPVSGAAITAESFGASPSATATANTTAINAALATGGLVTLNVSGTVYINNTLIIPSNTEFRVGAATTIRMSAGAAQLMIANTAYSATPVNISSLTSSGTVATCQTASAHGLIVGQWVSVHGSQTSGYNGVYLVQSTTDSTHFTYNTEIIPAATTAIVSTRYSNMTTRPADTNIRIFGGTWYYDLTNNPAGNGVPNGGAVILAHIYNYSVENFAAYDVGNRVIWPFNARGGVLRGLRCDKTRVCIQTNGAIHGLHVFDVDSFGTDDGIAIMARENGAFSSVTLSEGDVINVLVERVNLNHGVVSGASAVAIYNFDQLHVMDNIEIDSVAGSCYRGIYITGAPGTLSSYNNIGIKNVGLSCQAVALVTRYCSIKGLTIRDFQPQLLAAAQQAIIIDGQSSIDSLFIDGFTFTPFSTTSTAPAIQFISTATAVSRFSLRNFRCNNGWVPSSAAFAVQFDLQPGLWEISDTYLNAGANAVLGYLNAAGKTGTFRNCEVVTCRLTNQSASGTMNLLNVKDCRVINSNLSMSVAASMAINFDGYETDGGTSAMQFNGANSAAIVIRGKGFVFNGMGNMVLANSPLVTVYAWDYPVDAGLLQTTQGQFFTHKSAVAGRNASNQQGPCIAVDGTHFYALGTGASGVNTLVL